MNRHPYLVLLVAAAYLGACNSGDDTPPKRADTARPTPPPIDPSPWAYKPCESNEGASPAPTNAAVDGLWHGTLTNELRRTTEPWTAIVSADGRFHLLSSGHTQMVGTLEVDGNGYAGEGFAETGGQMWHDGTQQSALTVAGTITERAALSGEFALASGDAGCFTFAYNAYDYERPSSLDQLAGRWIDYDDWSFLWITLDVTREGALTGVDMYGCSHAGSITLLDERFNLYAVALEITQRTDESYGCWGKGSYEGFAHLNDNGSDGSQPDNLHLSIADGNTAYRFTLVPGL